jgi:predicted transcriptional regulator
MRDEEKGFSLSHYFDELKRRRDTKGIETLSGAQKPASFSTSLSIVKALKESDTVRLPFMRLARASGLTLDRCKEAVRELQKEGIVEVEPDYETGNDTIRLTLQGEELLS